MHTASDAAREIPDNPGVHVAEEQFALLGLRAGPLDIVENPLDLGAGEIGGQRQTDFQAETVLTAILGEFIADQVGARVLPDDGVIDGLAGRLLPHNRGLALVGDTHRGDVLRIHAGLGQRAGDDSLGASPDRHRIVFDPARLRVDLWEFLLVEANHLARMIKDHEACAGRPLVNCGCIFSHDVSPEKLLF